MNATFVVLLILGYLIFFPLFWIGVVWLISRFGWVGLAAHWATTEIPTGMAYTLVQARVGLTRYRNSLNIWLTESGLFLEPIWFFRVGHRRLFIPWQAVQDIQPSQVLWLHGAKLELQHGLTVILYGKAGSDILEMFKPKG